MTSYLYKRTKQLLKRLPLSVGHAWCMALQLLFEQNLTLISTEIKITGVIRYDKSSCPWPGCLLQSKRGLPQSSHWLCAGWHKALRSISQALTRRKHFLRYWVWNYPPHVQLDYWSSANTDLLLSSYCCGCGWTRFTRCWWRYSVHWTWNRRQFQNTKNMQMGANGSHIQLFTVATFFWTAALVHAAEKSISLLHMTIPREVRWALGSTMIHSILQLWEISTTCLKSSGGWIAVDQHSLSRAITFITFDVIFM